MLCGDSATVAIWSVFPSSNFNQGSFALPADKCNSMQCNAMQCNAMQCNAMQCNAMQCGSILFLVGGVWLCCAATRRLWRFGRMSVFPSINFNQGSFALPADKCNSMQCGSMQCGSMQCGSMQCGSMQCNVVQCNVVQCNAMQCNVVR